jgi:hypothetical protein
LQKAQHDFADNVELFRLKTSYYSPAFKNSCQAAKAAPPVQINPVKTG